MNLLVQGFQSKQDRHTQTDRHTGGDRDRVDWTHYHTAIGAATSIGQWWLLPQ